MVIAALNTFAAFIDNQLHREDAGTKIKEL